MTVFLSSHVLAEVARLATRIGIIHAGQLREEFAAAKLSHRVRRRLSIVARDMNAAAAVLTKAGYTCSTEDGAVVCAEERAVERPDDIAVAMVAAGCPPTRLAVESEDLAVLKGQPGRRAPRTAACKVNRWVGSTLCLHSREHVAVPASTLS